jgi:sigma-E factor negative regulatory protein RseC
MEEIGIVKEADGPKAIVVVKRQSGCDACPAGSSCKVTQSGAEIEAYNAVHAAAGDTVKISFRAFTYLKGTLLMYGMPALALVVGVIVGKEYLREFLPAIDADLISAMAGFGFMIVAVAGMKLFVRKFEKKRELIPVIEEIMQKGH